MVYDDAGKRYLQRGGDDGGDGGGSAEWWPDREAVQRGSTHCRHGDGRCCHHAMHARVAAQLQPLAMAHAPSRRETWQDDDDVDCTFLFLLSRG